MGTGDLSEQNEQIVREYFENRGWSVKKLPKQKPSGQVSDFEICRDNVCFLCEVKAISSVRANIPYAPVDNYFIDVREIRRAEVEKWIRENPDKRLILHKEEHEFLYSDEWDLRKRYRHRRRNTEAEFEEHFAEPVRRYFAQSSICHLPYVVSLHSDDLYTPKPEERDDFCKWLEGEIRSIDKGMPSWHFRVTDRQGPGLPAFYTAFLSIHKATYEGDIDSQIHVQVVGPGKQEGLQVHIPCYGGLNLDAIDRNVKEARNQLKDTASREQNPNIARVVVLAFATGINLFDWEELSPHIAELLEEYRDLSAMAVLDWVADGTPPPREEGPLAWLSFQAQAPRVPRFIVCHNSWLRDVEPLNTEACDEPSVHIPTNRWKRQT